MDTSNGDSSPAAGNFNSITPHRDSHSSPESSPRTDVNPMDASVELNGANSGAENRSSQQFCLRWNNHQVRSRKLHSTKSLYKSIGSHQRQQVHFDGHSSTNFFLRCTRNCIPTPIFSEEFFYFGCYRMLLLLKNKTKEKKSATDFP